MKKYLTYIYIVLFSFVICPKVGFAMQDPSFGRYTEEVADTIEKKAIQDGSVAYLPVIQNIVHQIGNYETKLKDHIEELKRLNLSDAADYHDVNMDRMKEILEKQITHYTAQIEQLEKQKERMFQEYTAISSFDPKRAREQAKNEAMIRAAAAHVTAATSIKTFMEEMRKSETQLAVGGVSVGIIGSYFALKYGFAFLKDYLAIPTLAEETSLESFLTRIYRIVSRIPRKNAAPAGIVCNESLQEKITELINGFKNSLRNGASLPHLLFYGKPGSGKTLIAKYIAQSCGLDYIYFSAASLGQFTPEDALKKIRELHASAESSSKKLVVIMDECESLFGTRDKVRDSATHKLLNQLLTLTGNTIDNKNFIIIGITNRYDDLDEAILSRFAQHIFIPLPPEKERVYLIQKYSDYLLRSTQSYKKSPSLFMRLIGHRSYHKPIKFENGTILDENDSALLAKKMEGFSGRDIASFILDLQRAALATSDGVLTQKTYNRLATEALERICSGK